MRADSLYEAAVLAIKIFREHDCPLGLGSRLEVEVRSPGVTRTVTVKKLQDWLDGGGNSPRDLLLKKRLKELLAAS